MDKEVRPSFSWKYLVLTLITALIVSAVGLGASKLYQSRPVREIIVYDDGIINLLNDAALPKDQIETTYFLKGDPKKKIQSLFLSRIAIKNAGNEGVENLLVTFNLKEADAFFVYPPKIRTEPTDIGDAVTVNKKEGENTSKIHLWNISLLNPGESVIFEYSIYSEVKLENITLNVSPRKKDWVVSTNKFLSQKKESTSSKDWLIAAASPILFFLSIFLIVLPFYITQWIRRSDYRENYGNFMRFYMMHHPRKLFDPPSPKKEIVDNRLD